MKAKPKAATSEPSSLIPHPSSLLLRGRHYATGEWIDVECTQAGIRAVSSGGVERDERSFSPHASRPTPHASLPTASRSPFAPDFEAGWIAPALFDLQINGCEGLSFGSGNLGIGEISRITDRCRQHGLGQFLATLITNDHDSLPRGMRQIRQACMSSPGIASALAGIHLEGPYISAEDGPRGAHPRRHVRPPDWNEFQRLQDAAEGMIRLVTLAPEHEGALQFIEKLARSGVVVAIGHTAAGGDTIRAAVGAGARLSTHLGNGAHAVLPRHDNYIWEQLGEDALWASLICDGHHLPPSVVRCMIRVKTPARTILTCDLSSLAGLPPGKHREWDQDLEILPEGKIIVQGTSYLAGSHDFTDACVGNAIRFAGVTLAEAVDMAGARPRELLGLPPLRIEAGMPANLVLFDWKEGEDFKVRATILNGSVNHLEGERK